MTATELSQLSVVKEQNRQKSLMNFAKTIPQGVMPKGYDIETLWESYGMPSDFQSAEAIGMIPKDETGYNLPAWDVKSGKALIPFDGSEAFANEASFYYGKEKESQDFRNKFRLNTSDKYWKYDKVQEGDRPIVNDDGITVGHYNKKGVPTFNKKREVFKDGKLAGFYNTNTSKFEPFNESDYSEEPNIFRVTQNGQKSTKQDVSEEDFASQDELRVLKDRQNEKNKVVGGEEIPAAMTPPNREMIETRRMDAPPIEMREVPKAKTPPNTPTLTKEEQGFLDKWKDKPEEEIPLSERRRLKKILGK